MQRSSVHTSSISSAPSASSAPAVSSVAAAVDTSYTASGASVVTMEEVLGQFQLWRLSKKRRFEPIPVYLKDMTSKLLTVHSVSKVALSLHLSSRMVHSIQKAYGNPDFLKSSSSSSSLSSSGVSKNHKRHGRRQSHFKDSLARERDKASFPTPCCNYATLNLELMGF